METQEKHWSLQRKNTRGKGRSRRDREKWRRGDQSRTGPVYQMPQYVNEAVKSSKHTDMIKGFNLHENEGAHLNNWRQTLQRKTTVCCDEQKHVKLLTVRHRETPNRQPELLLTNQRQIISKSHLCFMRAAWSSARVRMTWMLLSTKTRPIKAVALDRSASAERLQEITRTSGMEKLHWIKWTNKLFTLKIDCF